VTQESSLCWMQIEAHYDIAPLLLHRNFWQYIKGGGKSKYLIRGNICSHTFLCSLVSVALRIRIDPLPEISCYFLSKIRRIGPKF
jgi:hypothetical protein